MFNKLELENWKSIQSAKTELGRLAVIVGANGSGKSNLIKALEFLSANVSRGLQDACTNSGGWSGIVPKCLTPREMKACKVRFKYSCKLPPPENYPEEFPPIIVEHSLELGLGSRDEIKITSESLKFYELLNLEAAFDAAAASSDDKEVVAEKQGESFFLLSRGLRGSVKFETKPEVTTKTLSSFVRWLGFGFAKDSISSKTKLLAMLRDIGDQPRRGISLKDSPKARLHSLTDPKLNTPMDMTPQFGAFMANLREIRRYDLSLQELRPEQKSSASAQLSSSGDNMPSVLRHLQKQKGGEPVWEKLVSTFGSIAPHIGALSTKNMGGGREFVEFVESKMGRGVESWESSDGSLRALAILLAVETHPRYGTLLIEEPEQNLHPWAVRSLMEHIREAVHRRELQVILTTHSQQVLEQTEPGELLIASRSQANGTVLSSLEDLPHKGDIRMGDVGRLWVKGLLGGIPSFDE